VGKQGESVTMDKPFDNTNRGSIWKNEKKETEKHPDFTGTANLDGVEVWVSAWKRKPGASEKAPALSFAFTRKDSAPVQKPVDNTPGAVSSEDIPF